MRETFSSDNICLDASVVLAFVFPDELLHDQAVALVKALSSGDVKLCAPAMFAYECDSVIRLRLYKGELSHHEAQTARALVDALAVLVEFDPDNADRAFAISCEYDQPRAYDAAYAAYAESRRVELITADRPFFEAVNGSKRPKKLAALSFVKLLS